MKKARKGTVLTILIMLVVVAGIAAAFFWVRKNRGKESRQEQTEVEKLLEYDLEGNYPGNAREVVKTYNQIMKCFYNETLSDKELEGLAGQIRILFDTELLKRNPLESYLESLELEIEEYKEKKRTISIITIQDYDDVLFETKGEYKTASLLSCYRMKEGTEQIKSNIRYYLREDEERKWRILFWELSNEDFE